MTQHKDLTSMKEADRITMIGEKARTMLVGVLVDADGGKPQRYIDKVLKQFPDVSFVDQFHGPTRGVVTIRFRPKETN